MKYLNYYHEWMRSNQLTDDHGFEVSGLCKTPISNGRLFNRIEPIDEDYYEAYWARGGDDYAGGKFSPLRQTFVLFLAAMNNEL